MCDCAQCAARGPTYTTEYQLRCLARHIAGHLRQMPKGHLSARRELVAKWTRGRADTEKLEAMIRDEYTRKVPDPVGS